MLSSKCNEVKKVQKKHMKHMEIFIFVSVHTDFHSIHLILKKMVVKDLFTHNKLR